jgi:purine-binding chemotaxis protein CheW
MNAQPVLLTAVGTRACAFPLGHVIETMRPLPIESLNSSSGLVRGLSIIRGVPTPVVALSRFFGASGDAVGGRFVTLRIEERQVAVEVDSVLGIRILDRTQLDGLPPLMESVETSLVEAVGARDARLLLVLQSARLVPQAVWAMLSARTEGRGS